MANNKYVYIGDKKYDWDWVNDKKNYNSIREQVVSGGDIKVEDKYGNMYDNMSGSKVGNSYENQLNDYYNNRKNEELNNIKLATQNRVNAYNGQISNINMQYQNAINDLDNRKKDTNTNYYHAKNATGATNNAKVSQLREAMANMGLSSSGANAQAQMDLANQHMGNINNLDLQKQGALDELNTIGTNLNNNRANALSDIAQQIANIQSEQALQEQSLVNNLNAQKSQQLYDLMNKQYDRELDDTRYNQQWDYQVGRDKVQDDRYNKEWDYNVGRDKVQDDRYTKQWDYNVSRDKIGDERYNKEFDYKQQIDDRQYQQWLKEFENNNYWKQQSQSLQQQQMSNSNYWKQLEWDAAQAKANQPESAKIGQVLDMADSMYLNKNPTTGEIGVSDPDKLRAFIISSGLSNDDITKALLRYGLDPRPKTSNQSSNMSRSYPE